ncbi:hypothetical protein RHSIM_Rhsim08G0081300 [Rhododendron simsii]|uniref:Uncharacterized protein n=1 Tax=Rhododendron simsii TaxID=118357 RepID=A0A834GPG7_RHOSS|nr:hypothetical protein RHSIM_Rhsim08G0081300 [Rhododendron simsii]
MDNSQNASYQTGQAKGQAQEKGNQMMDKASNAAQSCKETMQEVLVLFFFFFCVSYFMKLQISTEKRVSKRRLKHKEQLMQSRMQLA